MKYTCVHCEVGVWGQEDAIRIKLSRTPLDTTNPGYQAPLPADQVQPIQEDEVCVFLCLCM
jgi:hypothetical protein